MADAWIASEGDGGGERLVRLWRRVFGGAGYRRRGSSAFAEDDAGKMGKRRARPYAP
jgi:hypothetical protein